MEKTTQTKYTVSFFLNQSLHIALKDAFAGQVPVYLQSGLNMSLNRIMHAPVDVSLVLTVRHGHREI